MIVIHLARKPLAEANVAANVLRFGTGAVHIDGSRVPSDGSHHGGSRFFKQVGGRKG